MFLTSPGTPTGKPETPLGGAAALGAGQVPGAAPGQEALGPAPGQFPGAVQGATSPTPSAAAPKANSKAHSKPQGKATQKGSPGNPSEEALLKAFAMDNGETLAEIRDPSLRMLIFDIAEGGQIADSLIVEELETNIPRAEPEPAADADEFVVVEAEAEAEACTEAGAAVEPAAGAPGVPASADAAADTADPCVPSGTAAQETEAPKSDQVEAAEVIPGEPEVIIGTSAAKRGRGRGGGRGKSVKL